VADILPKNAFVRINKQGLYEVIDENTGNILSVQKTAEFKQEKKLIPHILEDGSTVNLEEGVDPKAIGLKSIRQYEYNLYMANIICQKVAEGKTLLSISKDPDMPPYYMILQWRRKNKDFEQALANARRDRADFYHEEAIDTAMSLPSEATEKEYVAASRTKIDTLMKASERENPEKYNVKQKGVEVNVAAQTVVYETGVPPSKYNEKDVGPNLVDNLEKEELKSMNGSSETDIKNS